MLYPTKNIIPLTTEAVILAGSPEGRKVIFTAIALKGVHHRWQFHADNFANGYQPVAA
jgi:hypothetical protein